MKPERTKAIAALLLAGFGYALYGPLTRYVGTDLGPVTQTLIRGLMRLGLLFAIWRISPVSEMKLIIRPDRKKILILAIAAVLTTLFYIPSIIFLPMGTTMLLFYAMGTIASYGIGLFLFREKLSTLKILSLLLALSGIIITFSDNIGFGNQPLYVFSAMFAGIAYGIYSSISKTVSSKYPLKTIMLTTLLIETVIYGFVWLFSGEPIIFKWQPWLANLVYAADVIGITWLVFYGFRYLEAQIGSLLLLSELVFIVVIGAIFYREIPTLMQIIGAGLILLGLITPNLFK